MSTDWKRSFIIIWSGQFFSLLSSTLVNFAIIIWLSIQTGSAQVLAFAAIAGLLPQALLGPFTGVLIDRWNRKHVMIGADAFIAFSTLIISTLFFLDIKGMGFIYFLLAVRSVGTALHQPAMQASVPLLAPESQLTRIAGINQVIFSISNIAGPVLAALFISMFEIGYVLLIDVIGAAIAITTLTFVKIPNPVKAEGHVPHYLREMKEAFTAIRSVKGMTVMFLCLTVVMLVLMPVSIMFPLMTLQHFKGTTYQMSFIEAVWGLGMLAGGAILGLNKFKFNEVKLLNFTYVVLGICFGASGFLPASGYLFFVVLTALSGVVGAANHATIAAIIQKKIDPAYLGRVFSLNFSIALIPSMAGLLGAGYIADTIGLTYTFIISGAIILLTGIAAYFSPSLKELGKPLSEPLIKGSDFYDYADKTEGKTIDFE